MRSRTRYGRYSRHTYHSPRRTIEPIPPTVSGMVEGLHHVAIAVSDIPRAASFYEEVLGFHLVGSDDPEKTPETADYFWIGIGDDEWMNLADRPDATPDCPGEKDDPHLVFHAIEDEIHITKQRLADRNVEVRESGPSIYFQDPDSNFLELTHWNGPGT